MKDELDAPPRRQARAVGRRQSRHVQIRSRTTDDDPFCGKCKSGVAYQDTITFEAGIGEAGRASPVRKDDPTNMGIPTCAPVHLERAKTASLRAFTCNLADGPEMIGSEFDEPGWPFQAPVPVSDRGQKRSGRKGK